METVAENMDTDGGQVGEEAKSKPTNQEKDNTKNTSAHHILDAFKSGVSIPRSTTEQMQCKSYR